MRRRRIGHRDFADRPADRSTETRLARTSGTMTASTSSACPSSPEEEYDPPVIVDEHPSASMRQGLSDRGEVLYRGRDLAHEPTFLLSEAITGGA